jgi:hypothetical protein
VLAARLRQGTGEQPEILILEKNASGQQLHSYEEIAVIEEGSPQPRHEAKSKLIATPSEHESKLPGEAADLGKQVCVTRYKIAEAYAVVGDTTSALRALRRSIENGFLCYPYFMTDPVLENIRGQAEFAQLMAVARQRHEAFVRARAGADL